MELEPQMVVSRHVVLGTELEPLLLFHWSSLSSAPPCILRLSLSHLELRK